MAICFVLYKGYRFVKAQIINYFMLHEYPFKQKEDIVNSARITVTYKRNSSTWSIFQLISKKTREGEKTRCQGGVTVNAET